jgi:hypothetical protein
MARRALVKLGLARHALATTNRPNIVSVSLIVEVDVAIVEIDVPRAGGEAGVSSTGPIDVGLRISVDCSFTLMPLL